MATFLLLLKNVRVLILTTAPSHGKHLLQKVAGVLNSLGKDIVRSLTGWDSLLQALSLSVI